jgi:hypothetical protein
LKATVVSNSVINTSIIRRYWLGNRKEEGQQEDLRGGEDNIKVDFTDIGRNRLD